MLLSPLHKPILLLTSSNHHYRHLRHLSLLHRPNPSNPPNPLNPQNPSNHPNPYTLMNKSDPIQTLSSLWSRSFSLPLSFSFPNLSGFLRNFDLWILSYQLSLSHLTSSSSFPPSSAIHHPTLRSLLSLLTHVTASPGPHSFSWGSSTHLLLRSPADPPFTKPISKRKFLEKLHNSPPPFQDRVVQELLLLILEPVFEPTFSPSRSPSARDAMPIRSFAPLGAILRGTCGLLRWICPILRMGLARI